MQESKRLNYIDATKGVAILCITFLHFEQGVIPIWLNTWIALFMTTTFYLTSGWVTGINGKTIKPKELLKKRIRQLGVPYLWFSILIIAFNIIWVLFGLMESETLLRDIYKTATLRGIGALWFLPSLVIGEYIFTVIRNSIQKWYWGVSALAFTIVASYIYEAYWWSIRETSALNKIIDAPVQIILRGLQAWPIICIGYTTARIWGLNLQNINKMRSFIVSVALLAISLWLIICPPFEIYYLNKLLSNTLPAIAFMYLFTTFQKNIITRFFTYWGVNSLILMCTHFSITMEILMAFDKYVLHHPVFEGPVTILYFAVCILLTYPLVNLFNGKLKFIIGK